MKTSKRYIVKSGNIHTLKDLDLEKKRLRFEILKTEQDIHTGYRDILQALTFKDLAVTMINDLSTTSTVLSKAFDIGKAFMAKRKKKKQDKLKSASTELLS